MPWSDLPKEVFRERLRTYFLGFAIGLILMGLVLYTRWRFVSHQRAAMQSGGPPPATGRP